MEGVEFIQVESVKTLKTLDCDGLAGKVILDCRWFNQGQPYKDFALHLNILYKKMQFYIIVENRPMFHKLKNWCGDMVQKLVIAGPELSNGDILNSINLLESAYGLEAKLPELFEMHPLLKWKFKEIICQSKKKSNKKKLAADCVSTEQGSSRSTKRAVFKQILKFKVEANKCDVDDSSDSIEEENETKNDNRVFQKSCYVCKKRLKDNEVTFCKPCFELNDQMLKARTPLQHRYAIVTGGRIKIGLYISLFLLRDGCNVIVTTRFPNCARNLYSHFPDYVDWKDRVQFKKLDLLDMCSVQQFILWTKDNLPHLDILINNAAQTIWRPSQYFDELQQQEKQFALENTNLDEQGVLSKKRKHNSNENTISMEDEQEKTFPGNEVTFSKPTDEPLLKKQKNLIADGFRDTTERSSFTNETLSASSTLSYKANELFHNPVNNNRVWFPHGSKGDDGQQLDLRPMNSWRLKLTDIPFSELLQVLTINSIAPFVLISQLKPLLLASPFERKFVVNVSAMEGQFSRFNKGPHHVHTNMAKAALNMLTRTTGVEFENDNIYMTAVDTGWCTDERPYGQAQHEKGKGFQVPLREEDGAARVYHPIHHGLNVNNKPYFAVFLKNYKVHHW